MIVVTDEIRTYVMLNYANVNWTSSTQAGSLFGRGGKQSALVCCDKYSDCAEMKFFE